jgi:integrase
VFTTAWSGPVHPDTVSSLIGDLVRAHNVTVGENGGGELLPHARLHDLRHVHATTSFAKGVPDRVIMEVLGHAEIGITMNTYAHVLPVLRQEAADAMDELFGA